MAKTPCQRIIDSQYSNEKLKESLFNEFKKLDPVFLLGQIKEAQAEFWIQSIQSGKKEFAAKKELDLHALSDNEKQPPNNNHADIVAPANDLPIKINLNIRAGKRKKEKDRGKPPRLWRTRKDPFEQVWGTIEIQLQVQPDLTAKTILDDLLVKFPSNFNNKQIRTLQRRVALWRAKYSKQKNGAYLENNGDYDKAAVFLNAVFKK